MTTATPDPKHLGALDPIIRITRGDVHPCRNVDELLVCGHDSGRQSKAPGRDAATRPKASVWLRSRAWNHSNTAMQVVRLPACLLLGSLRSSRRRFCWALFSLPLFSRLFAHEQNRQTASHELKIPCYHPFNEKDRVVDALQRSCAVDYCLRLAQPRSLRQHSHPSHAPTLT
jgi:hypothetical protein